MNGEVLPPVIFTNCPTVPQDVEADSNAKVIYVPHLNQPTGELTLRWLTELEEYLDDQPLLVHDKGPEFEANVVKEYCDLHRIQLMEIPSAGGAFVNPCDNPFNSQLKHNYFTQEQKSYSGKLKAIIQAYYAPSTKTLLNYFKHVLWTGPRPTKADVKQLVSEGYRPGRQKIELYEEMKNVYASWKKNIRDSSLVKQTTVTHPTSSHTWYVWKPN